MYSIKQYAEYQHPYRIAQAYPLEVGNIISNVTNIPIEAIDIEFEGSFSLNVYTDHKHFMVLNTHKNECLRSIKSVFSGIKHISVRIDFGTRSIYNPKTKTIECKYIGIGIKPVRYVDKEKEQKRLSRSAERQRKKRLYEKYNGSINDISISRIMEAYRESKGEY